MNPETLAKFRSPAPCIGTWLSLGSPVVAEMASHCGFDWLLIDMEHGSMAESAVLPMLQALQSHQVAAVVRVPSHEPSLIARVLDWGADGIMVPHVSSATEAENLVRATRYPPDGIRGYSRTVRAFGYGTLPADSTTRPLLLTQIECLEGVRNAEAIAGVPGVDVLFVGPADLQLSLSVSKGAPGYNEALDTVAQAAKTHGISAGILIRDPGESTRRLQQGFSKVAMGSDLGLLRDAFQKAARALCAS